MVRTPYKTPINSTKTVGIVDVSKYACLTGCSKSCLVGRRTADVYCGTALLALAR